MTSEAGELHSRLEQIPPKNPDHLSAALPQSARVWSTIGLLVIGVVIVIGNIHAWQWMFQLWMADPDNSHGMLVPFFAIALLWFRRGMIKPDTTQNSVVSFLVGLTLIALGTAMKCGGIYSRTITIEAVSIIPCLAGVVTSCWGWRGARLAWPSVLFLVFMIPLPRLIGAQLSGVLQHIATVSSTYCMQVLGMPAVAEGNIIYLTHSTLGVAEACSGIRMLMSFFALTTAICFVVDRTFWEKSLIWLSAPVIAIVANVLRIIATGMAYEFGSERLAALIFHDLAGWLMVLVGLFLLWIELCLLTRIYPSADDNSTHIAVTSPKTFERSLSRPVA